jgi:leishmanolysin-like peptidase
VYAVEFLPQFIRRNQQQLQPLSSSREEYWNVRREIRRIEERMTRYQTGRNADPDHWVPYENHPYENMEQTRKRRSLQDTDPTSGNFTNEEALFRPIRIVFYTQALDDMRDSTNAAKIDWYKNTILPLTRHFWTAALSVVPVSGNLRITSGELDGFSYCGDSEFTQVPNEHKNTGVPDADLVLYVSGSPSSRFCPARTLAVAVPCNFDQFDRPTAGAINVCLDTITLKSDGTASPDVVQDYVDVTIHEVGHVLGMSSNSFRFFWDSETGQPRTARPFSEKTVTCVDGNSRTLILPDENTLVFHEEEDGSRYASIVTPKVQAIARNQFNCQEMIGAHLENQDTRDDSCFGDHWDERFFYPEAMSAVISPTTNVFSSLTLALMEDTGWYLSNYSISRMSSFGLGAGCDFVKNKCLQIDESGNTVVPNYSKGYFCNQGAAKGCSAELTHKLACTVLDYSFYVPQELPAAQYQYFPNEPSKGGPEQADYCPVFGTTYNNLRIDQLDCTNPSNTPSLNVYR